MKCWNCEQEAPVVAVKISDTGFMFLPGCKHEGKFLHPEPHSLREAVFLEIEKGTLICQECVDDLLAQGNLKICEKE